jgi:hypothetical protein
VEDLWSLDPEALSELTDPKAFIFLFKYVGGLEESSKAGKSVRLALGLCLRFELWLIVSRRKVNAEDELSGLL